MRSALLTGVSGVLHSLARLRSIAYDWVPSRGGSMSNVIPLNRHHRQDDRPLPWPELESLQLA